MIAASHRYTHTHTPRENFEELCGTLITSEVQLQQQQEEEEQRQLHRPLGDPKRRRESRQKFHCSRRAKSCRQVDFKWPLLPFSPPFHAPAFLLAQSLALTTPLLSYCNATAQPASQHCRPAAFDEVQCRKLLQLTVQICTLKGQQEGMKGREGEVQREREATNV